MPTPRLESTEPERAPELVVSLGDEWGHALAILRGRLEEPERTVALRIEPGVAPRLERDGEVVERDPLTLARALAPDLFVDDPRFGAWRVSIARTLIEGGRAIAREDDQARYEEAWDGWRRELEAVEAHLTTHRYLLGDAPSFVDVLLYVFAVRLDAVYCRLYKANPHLLEDLPALHAFARDLHEEPAFFAALDWDALIREPTEAHPVLAPRGILSRGGRPDLHAPHFRHELSPPAEVDASIEEDAERSHVEGEFVRGRSRLRGWVGTEEHPAEAGRYHLFAPYNCPWSHRALLARSVKGLEEVVGVSVVCFRRHPERGWQFNPAIEGCTEDRVHGRRFVAEYYEAQGSSERSVPILYDTETERIVNNESAEILRMFDDAFGPLASRSIRLYPEEHREAIDRVNELVYQRINNGAYKAGFARSQRAYEQAFSRYFAGLRWVDEQLADRDWLVGSEEPTEADLRLFPTVFRHDAVYHSRFRLDAARVRDYRNLARWLDRMLAWPGVAEASDLDHARNGYFGRTGNEIVPAGPVPLGLSPKDYPRAVWLGDA